MNITKFFSWTFLLLAFVTFIFFSSIVSLITDWWWYQEVGFTEIFIKSLSAKFIVGTLVGILAAIFLLTNLNFAIRSKIPWMAAIPEALIGLGQPLNLSNRLLGKLGIILSCIIAVFIGLIAASSWHDVLKFLSSVQFGQKDPIFAADVSFYVFSLPVFSLGLGLIKTVTAISLIGCTLIYVLRGSINLSRFLLKAEPKARLHIGILLFLFLATIAAGTYLSLYNQYISSQLCCGG
ncbi:MAG: hypothetical protein G01um10147_1142 [Microgenomates group bacterium Gr01-1014_7]|nr:MAG: hypothetical protein G01um10147_1142 [Microgenomates group bacterium Gr01-1014_7]